MVERVVEAAEELVISLEDKYIQGLYDDVIHSREQVEKCGCRTCRQILEHKETRITDEIDRIYQAIDAYEEDLMDGRILGGAIQG